MATDPQARAEIRSLKEHLTELEAAVAALKPPPQPPPSNLEPRVTALEQKDVQHEVMLSDHEGRIKALEPTIPPDPEPGPLPPVAECTTTQLASPPAAPFTMQFEYTDQGPDAIYRLQTGKNTDEDPAEDIVEGPERVVQVVYPHEGARTAVLTVTTPAGVSEPHTHTFTVEKPTEPPPDGGGGTQPPPSDGEYGDLYSLRPSTMVDDADLASRLNTLYEGDAVIGVNLNRVTEKGLQRLRHTFDRRGLSCANDVSCQCGSKRIEARQEIWDRFRFATSPNWLAYDEKCAPGDTIGDMKLKFIDTVGGYSGRSGGLLSHNNAQPGAPQGSLYMEESLPPKAPGIPSRGEWIGVTFAPGVVYEIRQHWRYSTGPTSNDGVSEVQIGTIEADGSFKLVKNWGQFGFSTRGDTEDQAERTEGNSWCHNQSTGRHDEAMYIDVFDVDIYSTRPAHW